VKPPEDTVVTIEDYENAHDDFRTTIDGKKYVTALTTRGTALIPVEESDDE